MTNSTGRYNPIYLLYNMASKYVNENWQNEKDKQIYIRGNFIIILSETDKIIR